GALRSGRGPRRQGGVRARRHAGAGHAYANVASSADDRDSWKARAESRSPDRLPPRLGSGTAWQALLAGRAWRVWAARADVQTDRPARHDAAMTRDAAMQCRDMENDR